MIQQLLPPNQIAAPKKKLRGRGRYIRKMLFQAAMQRIGVGHSRWYDQWHYHADWDGYGNLGWRLRAPILQALAIVFSRFARQLPGLKTPYQVWICVNASDSGQDAVFVHTPNHNQSKFPVLFGDAAWGIPEMSLYFEGLLPDYRFRAGMQQWMGTTIFFIYSPGVGVALEPN